MFDAAVILEGGSRYCSRWRACTGARTLGITHTLNELGRQNSARVLIADDQRVNQQAASLMVERLRYRAELSSMAMKPWKPSYASHMILC